MRSTRAPFAGCWPSTVTLNSFCNAGSLHTLTFFDTQWIILWFLLRLLGVALRDSGWIDEGPAYRPAPNFFYAIVGGHAKSVKAPVYGFQRRICLDFYANPGRGAVLNVNGCAHADLSGIAKRLERFKSGKFHEGNHVGRGINRWQVFVVGGQGVLKLDRHFSLAADSKGNWF